MLGYSNHLNMFSEEIAKSGEQLGNTPQAFSHLALIRYIWAHSCPGGTEVNMRTSAAFNLDRVTAGKGGM
jgi:hypothetical protein